MSSKINIFEMSLRDGLQNEAVFLNTEQRLELIRRLITCGAKKIEIGAFVSPQWVPQMKSTAKLVEQVLAQKFGSQYTFSTLVPNMRGLSDAIKSGVKEIAIFGAATESFSKKNINANIAESLETFRQVCAEAKKHKIKVRAYLSTVFGCPYEGKVDQKKVLKLIEKYLDLGVYELSIGDTIGVATPKQVKSLLTKINPAVRSKKIAMHFHDTRGTALANISCSLDLGIITFDSSLGGAGGCPYAPGAAGNVATEDVVYMLHGMGFKTGFKLEALVETTHWFNKQLGRKLPSKLSLTGAKSPIL